MAPDKSLAAEIEAVMKKHIRLNGREKWDEPYYSLLGFPEAAAEIAALQSRAFEDGARSHVAEALKREAQEQAFRRDLGEWCYASLKERLLKAAHMAFAGNDRALRRLVSTIENPVPIQGSAALAEQEKGDA